MWKWEVESLMPWLSGKGVDIGAGARSISLDIIRVDIDEKVKPDVLASGDELPFKDGEFDYLTSIHSFEHFEDHVKTLKEWLRVIKTGGIIGIVHPDIFYTKKQNPEIDKPRLKANPYNRHCHEHTQESFVKTLHGWIDLPFRILDSGTACANWSFYVILKKT
jgi:predicted SAM-dependent methyltransferase